jgi:multicomponent Na+:H+ antiporter subunit E
VRHWRGAFTQFVVLFGFWLLLSDEWRPLFFAIGAFSAAVVTLLTRGIVATVLREPLTGHRRRVQRTWWFFVYVGWMLGRIMVASLQMAYFALHPGLPFLPRFVTFRTTMGRPLSRVILATSITMVPGTMTVRLDGDEYLVHTLMPGAADDLVTARMQNVIGRFLGEAQERPPRMEWGPIIEEAVR